MAKNRQLKQTKKIRFDASMLFIGLCSLVGGYLVFTSYAAQHPNTTKPGTVSINALPKNGIYYRFSLSSRMKYCFESPQRFSKLKIYENKSLKESYTLTNACITPKKDYSDPVISITGVSASSQLTITER